MKKRETESKRESEQSVGMQAGEECGFHGNPRKAELWVSVPALHRTDPRLSATAFSLSLSRLLHYILLSTHTHPLLLSLPPSLPPIPSASLVSSPPSFVIEGLSLSLTHKHTPSLYYPHQS